MPFLLYTVVHQSYRILDTCNCGQTVVVYLGAILKLICILSSIRILLLGVKHEGYDHWGWKGTWINENIITWTSEIIQIIYLKEIELFPVIYQWIFVQIILILTHSREMLSIWNRRAFSCIHLTIWWSPWVLHSTIGGPCSIVLWHSFLSQPMHWLIITS